MSLTQVNSSDLKVSGSQPDSWAYATTSLPISKLNPGATYRLEGWIKVVSVSDVKYPPMLKLVAFNKAGIYLGEWTTFPYSLAKRGTWQKLWLEVPADDRFDHGYLAVDKGATNRLMKAVFYIRDVKFTKVQDNVTAGQRSSTSSNRLSTAFWPYKKSDVIGWCPGTLKDYQDYGVTFVSWGRSPSQDYASITEYCKMIRDASRVGTQIGASIGFKNNSLDFIKFNGESAILAAQTKDLQGKPIVIKEMSNIRGNGYPPYWLSINNPSYRESMNKCAERAMQCKPYGLVVDDVTGDTSLVLWGEGEYSDNSVGGFRHYLQSNFSPAQLQDNGISDIMTFDIRKFHQDYSATPPARRPFREDIIDFQLSSAASAFKEVKSRSVAALGRSIPVGANMNPASYWGDRFFRDVDYFSFECTMNAGSGKPNGGYSLLAYKMADAFTRPAVAMGSGADHAFVQDNHLPGMVRYWIAEAYALGNYFMAPYQLWAYSSHRGSYSYRPRSSKELAPLMRFIKSNGYLFDDYNSVVAPTALVLSYPSHTLHRTDFSKIVNDLIQRNLPFDIVVVGNSGSGLHLSESQLARYSSLLVPEGSILSNDDTKVLNKMKASGKSVIHRVDSLDKSSRIEIQGAANVMATLRAKSGERKWVLHLLNYDYNVKTDSYQNKHDFTVNIPKSLLGNLPVRQVKLFRPPSWPADGSLDLIQYRDETLEFHSGSLAIQIRVPILDIWGILEIEA